MIRQLNWDLGGGIELLKDASWLPVDSNARAVLNRRVGTCGVSHSFLFKVSSPRKTLLIRGRGRRVFNAEPTGIEAGKKVIPLPRIQNSNFNGN